MDINDLSYKVRKAIFTVHNELGPGLLEHTYEAVLIHELELLGLSVRSQVGLPVIYKNVKLDLGYRVDIIVEDRLIVEVKSVETLQNVHKKILLSYLRLSQTKLGILVNFNVDRLIDKESIVRIIN